MTRSLAILVVALLVAVVSVALWRLLRKSPQGPAGSSGAGGALFVDVSAPAGIDFVHENGARGRRFMPETVVGGAGWLDYDGDGLYDLYLVNGNRHPDSGARGEATNRLYRNLGDGTFRDVSSEAGVGDSGYGAGLAVGDYDNDGRSDLYVTNLGSNVLYHNEGEGRFREVTRQAGVEGGGWSTSSAFLDYDNDGYLDLYVCRYVDYDPSRECRSRGHLTYCSPAEFPGMPDLLYRNRGDGTFEDVSLRAGVAVAGPAEGKSLGVIVLDYDDDGDTDIYVACDQVPNLLFQNNGDGTLREVGLLTNVAYSSEGESQAGMGVDAGDVDLDGRADIVVTNFSDERNALYRNEAGGLFSEASVAFGLGGPTLRVLGFGVLFIDFDLDADLDLYVANGHVHDNIDVLRPGMTFAQRDQLLENIAGRGYKDISAGAGGWFSTATVSRAAASADFDEDGDEDIFVLNCGDRGALLRNDAPRGHWIALRLQGTRSNRDGYGAKVTVLARGAHGRFRRSFEYRSARSYSSACDPRVRVGLGPERVAVERVEIRWPSGIKQVLKSPDPDRVHVVTEPPREDTRVSAAGPGPDLPLVDERAEETPFEIRTRSQDRENEAGRERPAVPTSTVAPRGDPRSLLARANELAGRHRLDEALAVLEAYTRFHPREDLPDDAINLFSRQASLLLALSRPGEARTILEGLLKARPENHAVRGLLARSFLELENFSRAVSLYEELPPSRLAENFLEYSKALLGAGQGAVGRAVLAAGLIRDPWHDRGYLELGHAQVRLGYEASGKALLERYRAWEPLRSAEQAALNLEYEGDEALALLRRSRAEAERGRLYKSMLLANEAIRKNPGLGSAYLELARLSIFLERPQDAIAALTKLPAEARVLGVLGEAYEAAAEPGRALEAYRAALEKAPHLTDLEERLRRLEKATRSGIDPEAAGDDLARLRAEIRTRLRQKRLSASVDELLGLVKGYDRAERAAEARRLALFLLRLAPRRRDARLEVARLFDRPAEVFVRLWALAPLEDHDFQVRIRRELESLGLAPERVLRELRVPPSSPASPPRTNPVR